MIYLNGQPYGGSPDAGTPPPDVSSKLNDSMKNWRDAFSDLRNRPLHYLPYLNTYDIVESGMVLYSALAVKNKTATPEQTEFLRKHLEQEQRPTSWGYNVLSTMLSIPSFAVEFILTAPAGIGKWLLKKGAVEGIEAGTKIATKSLVSKVGTYLSNNALEEAAAGVSIWSKNRIGKEVGEGFAEQAERRLLKKMGKEAIEQARPYTRTAAKVMTTPEMLGLTGKGTIKAIVEGGVRAAMLPNRVINSQIQNMTPGIQLTEDELGQVRMILKDNGDDFWPALAKAYGEWVVETGTEQVGFQMGILTGLAGPSLANMAIKGAVLNRIAKSTPGGIKTFLSKYYGSGVQEIAGAAGKIAKKTGWNGVLGEIYEERVGDVIRFATGQQENLFPSFSQLSAEAVAFALNPMMMAGMAWDGVSDTVSRESYEQNLQLEFELRSPEQRIKTTDEYRSTIQKLANKFETERADPFYKDTWLFRKLMSEESRKKLKRFGSIDLLLDRAGLVGARDVYNTAESNKKGSGVAALEDYMQTMLPIKVVKDKDTKDKIVRGIKAGTIEDFTTQGYARKVINRKKDVLFMSHGNALSEEELAETGIVKMVNMGIEYDQQDFASVEIDRSMFMNARKPDGTPTLNTMTAIKRLFYLDTDEQATQHLDLIENILAQPEYSGANPKLSLHIRPYGVFFKGTAKQFEEEGYPIAEGSVPFGKNDKGEALYVRSEGAYNNTNAQHGDVVLNRWAEPLSIAHEAMEAQFRLLQDGVVLKGGGKKWSDAIKQKLADLIASKEFKDLPFVQQSKIKALAAYDTTSKGPLERMMKYIEVKKLGYIAGDMDMSFFETTPEIEQELDNYIVQAGGMNMLQGIARKTKEGSKLAVEYKAKLEDQSKVKELLKDRPGKKPATVKSIKEARTIVEAKKKLPGVDTLYEMMQEKAPTKLKERRKYIKKIVHELNDITFSLVGLDNLVLAAKPSTFKLPAKFVFTKPPEEKQLALDWQDEFGRPYKIFVGSNPQGEMYVRADNLFSAPLTSTSPEVIKATLHVAIQKTIEDMHVRVARFVRYESDVYELPVAGEQLRETRKFPAETTTAAGSPRYAIDTSKPPPSNEPFYVAPGHRNPERRTDSGNSIAPADFSNFDYETGESMRNFISEEELIEILPEWIKQPETIELGREWARGFNFSVNTPEEFALRGYQLLGDKKARKVTGRLVWSSKLKTRVVRSNIPFGADPVLVIESMADLLAQAPTELYRKTERYAKGPKTVRGERETISQMKAKQAEREMQIQRQKESSIEEESNTGSEADQAIAEGIQEDQVSGELEVDEDPVAGTTIRQDYNEVVAVRKDLTEIPELDASKPLIGQTRIIYSGMNKGKDYITGMGETLGVPVVSKSTEFMMSADSIKTARPFGSKAKPTRAEMIAEAKAAAADFGLPNDFVDKFFMLPKEVQLKTATEGRKNAYIRTINYEKPHIEDYVYPILLDVLRMDMSTGNHLDRLMRASLLPGYGREPGVGVEGGIVVIDNTPSSLEYKLGMPMFRTFEALRTGYFPQGQVFVLKKQSLNLEMNQVTELREVNMDMITSQMSTPVEQYDYDKDPYRAVFPIYVSKLIEIAGMEQNASIAAQSALAEELREFIVFNKIRNLLVAGLDSTDLPQTTTAWSILRESLSRAFKTPYNKEIWTPAKTEIQAPAKVAPAKQLPAKQLPEVRPPAASRLVATGEISFDPAVLKDRYEQKAWTQPRLLPDGTKTRALAPRAFTSYDNFLKFVALHEAAHGIAGMGKKASETDGQYEDRMNQYAFRFMDMSPAEWIPQAQDYYAQMSGKTDIPAPEGVSTRPQGESRRLSEPTPRHLAINEGSSAITHSLSDSLFADLRQEVRHSLIQSGQHRGYSERADHEAVVTENMLRSVNHLPKQRSAYIARIRNLYGTTAGNAARLASEQLIREHPEGPPLLWKQIASNFDFDKTFPDVFISTNVSKMKDHPYYEAAKKGNELAAWMVTDQLIRKDRALELKTRFPNAILIPIIAEERQGTNMLPAALATSIASITGHPIATNIIQTNRSFHTGVSAIDRLLISPTFSGPIIPGRNYIMVDDVATSGSSFGALYRFIKRGGGNPVAAMALAVSSSPQTGDGRQIVPYDEVLTKLQNRKDSAQILEVLHDKANIDSYRWLTSSQANYISSFKDVDTFRAKLASAESRASLRELEPTPGELTDLARKGVRGNLITELANLASLDTLDRNQQRRHRLIRATLESEHDMTKQELDDIESGSTTEKLSPDITHSFRTLNEMTAFSMTYLEAGETGLHRMYLQSIRAMRDEHNAALQEVLVLRRQLGMDQTISEKIKKRTPSDVLARAQKMLEAVTAKLEGSNVIVRDAKPTGERNASGWVIHEVIGEDASEAYEDWNTHRLEGMPSAEQVQTRMRKLFDEGREKANKSVEHLSDFVWLNYLQDYVTHRYQKSSGMTKEDFDRAIFRMTEEAKASHKRVLPTYAYAAKFGLLPLTSDATKIFQGWSDDTFKAAASKVILSESILVRNNDGMPVVVPIFEHDALPSEPSAISNLAYSMAARNLAEYAGVTFDATVDPRKEIQRIVRLMKNNKITKLAVNAQGEGMLDEKGNPIMAPVDFDKLGYVRVESPKTGVDYFWVQKGNAERIMKMIIDVQYQGDLFKVVNSVNQWSKTLTLFASLFHPFSLIESFISTQGMGKTSVLHRATWQKAWQLHKDIKNNPALLGPWIKYGAQITHADPNVHQGDVNKQLSAGLEYLSRNDDPFSKTALASGRAFMALKTRWDNWLWNDLQPTLKLASMEALYLERTADLDARGVNYMEDTLREEIASTVNSSYGGQEWEQYLWATPKAKQLLHLFMFAPDWTLSCADIAGATLIPGVREIIRPPMSATQIDIMVRKILPAMVIIALYGMPNLVQSMIYMAGGDPDEGDKPLMQMNELGKRTSIDLTPVARHLPGYLGGDSGKRRVYIRFGKQSYEVYEGWFQNFFKTLFGKTSTLVRSAYEQATGTSTGGFDLQFKGKGLAGLVMVDGSVLNSRVGYVMQKFVPASILTPLQGRPSTILAPSSRGASQGALIERMQKQLEMYAQPAVWDRIANNPSFVSNLEGLGDDVFEDASKNGIDPNEVYNRARSAALGKYYLAFFKAFNDQNPKKMEQAAGSVIRLHAGLNNLLQALHRRLVALNRESEFTPEAQTKIKTAYQDAQSQTLL